MKKIFVTESQFQKIVKESLNKVNLNESFSSNYLKTIIMQNGGLAAPTEYGIDRNGFLPSTYPVGKEYRNDEVPTHPFPGILDKLTDSDLLYRATHIEEFEEKIVVICKNGTRLTIPLTWDEYEEANDKGWERREYEKSEDGKNVYQPQSEVNQDKKIK